MKDFRPVNRPKISDLIIEQIREMILRGDLKPFEKLPSERQLAEKFKASRIAVREALKSLETAGLVKIKPGSGVFVSSGDGKNLTDSFYSILKVGNASLKQITEARLMFEPRIASLAAERARDEDIALLEENVKKTASVLASGFHSTNENLDFHILIGNATHNLVIFLTVGTLLEVARVMTLEGSKNREERLNVSVKSYEHHKLILEAIKLRAPDQAYRLMHEHISDVQKALIKAMSTS